MANMTKPSKETSVSFGNTPQAKDDNFAAPSTGLNEDSNNIVYLNVMANDLGGNAKALYSLDDADSAAAATRIDAPADLLVQDFTGAVNKSKYGAEISITADGKVAYNMDTTAFRLTFQSLAAGVTGYDTFTYAVRLGNGTLSWATATVEIAGKNDAPVVSNPLTSATNEDAAPYTINLLAGASDVDDGYVLHAGNVTEAEGKGGWTVADNQITITPDYFNHLNDGERGTLQLNYQVIDEHGAGVDQSLTVEIAGKNDAPVVSNPLTSATNEDAAPYTINLLAGASDVDDGYVLHAGNVTEAEGKGGWTVADNQITITPDYFNDLNDGEQGTLQLTYQVIDEHGAGVDQSLTVEIAGITDAPSLSVETSAGTKVNEIYLTVTSQPAHTERVALTFTDLPAGAVILNELLENVTAGIQNYAGTQKFMVVLPAGADADADLTVTATGFGTAIRSTAQTIELAYDVSSSTEELNFASANQNMWGDLPGYIGWHEYIPFLGGAPIVWDSAKGEWVEAATPDYWSSGQFNVVDVELDSTQILAAATTAATTVLDAARAVFNSTAFAVDTVAKGVFDAAKAVFQTAEDAFYFGARTVDAAVQQAFQAAKAAYDTAAGIYDAASYAFHTVATDVYNVACALDFLGWGRPAIDAAYHLAEGIWDTAKYAFETTATGLYNTALGVYNAAAGAVDAAAHQAFDDARAVFATAEQVYSDVQQGIHDAAQAVFDGAQSGVLAILDSITDKIAFDSALKVDAEIHAQVGLQVDFELDMGSVDTSIDYQLTSTTQYNQTTDMLAIAPTMTNRTTGDSVAFDTISPNAKFYAALLYDVGADLDVFIDGKLVVEGETIYDLSPGSEGLSIPFPVSTESFADALGVISGGKVDAGTLVLVDLNSADLEPYEVPFIEELSKGILTIEFAIPTLETEGTPATYTPGTTYQEGDLVNVDFSEISSAFFNILNAKFDFSEEFMDQYGLDSLGGKTLAETVEDIATGLMANIWDVVGGQSEGVPIFVLDMTDETSTSLVHLNLFPDSVMTDTASTDTGSLGFYAAYGESDPVVKVTLDVDAAYVFIVKEIAKIVADAVTAGGAAAVGPIIDLIPSPYNIEFGIEQVLKMALVPEATVTEITNWIDLGFSFETADLDVSQEANFSQEFTLSIDDMSYLVTMEDGVAFNFTANGTGALSIPNASSHDANGDGSIAYTLDIVPTAMFSNDTEFGLSLGYQLDFLKGGFAAGLQLPLGDLLGIEGADWLNIDFSAIDISMGPLLRVQGELDTLDVDVFESRFALNVGSASYAGAVDIELAGVNNAEVFA